MNTIYESRKGVTRELSYSRHTLPILFEYAYRMLSVCLQYAYSMATSSLEYGWSMAKLFFLITQTTISSSKYLRMALSSGVSQSGILPARRLSYIEEIFGCMMVNHKPFGGMTLEWA